jgi:hypothetical protein
LAVGPNLNVVPAIGLHYICAQVLPNISPLISVDIFHIQSVSPCIEKKEEEEEEIEK